MNKLVWMGLWLLVIVAGSAFYRILPEDWYYTAGFAVGSVAAVLVKDMLDAPWRRS